MNIKKNYILLLVYFFISGCSDSGHETVQPLSASAYTVRSLSAHKVTSQAYTLPEADFRSIFWPYKDDDNSVGKFEMRIIKNHKEIFIDVKTPEGFHEDLRRYDEDFYKDGRFFTGDWVFEIKKELESEIIYSGNNAKKNVSLEITLPKKIADYEFVALRNKLNKEILLFFNISENVIERGIFGYVLL